MVRVSLVQLHKGFCDSVSKSLSFDGEHVETGEPTSYASQRLLWPGVGASTSCDVEYSERCLILYLT